MAQTEYLPIYKSTYDLCLYLEQVVHDLARYHKYALQNEGWLKSQRQGHGQNRRAMPPGLATPSVS
jgi:hypothetical protein